MFKRIISMLAAMSMLCSITSVFANNAETAVGTDIVSTDGFTEDNVIYNAMMDADGGAALYSADSDDESEGITANFDVVLGFDMSSAMYGFDYNAEMGWLEDFKALSEQVPDGTRFSVVTNEVSEFSTDLDAELDELTGSTYSGSSDIVTLLDTCLNTFDSTDRNNVVIATAAEVSDAAELSAKMDELMDYGVVPFVFVLNQETNTELDDVDDVYQCTTELELRLAISDLYLSFAEFDNAAVTTADVSEESESASYVSDFRSIHKFSDALEEDTNGGILLAEILNIYGCVPMYAKISDEYNYDLFEDLKYTNGDNELAYNEELLKLFMKADNRSFSQDNESNLTDFKDTWEEIFTEAKSENDFWIDGTEKADEIVTKNLKRRFPVVGLKADEYFVIKDSQDVIGSETSTSTENAASNEDSTSTETAAEVTAVFDTYEYIRHLLVNNRITSKSELVNIDGETKNKITMTYPASYIVTDGDAEKVKITYSDVELNKTRHSVDFTLSQDQDVIVESLVTYTNGIGDVLNSNSRYIAKLYSDIPSSNVWYYDYVFAATNKEIINGYDENNVHLFRPEPKIGQADEDTYGKVTRGEFLKIVMSAIGYPVDDPEDEKLWAEEHIERANKMGALLDYTDKDYPANLSYDEKLSYQNAILTRKEAAYILTQVFIKMDNIPEDTLPLIPSVLYEHDENEKSEKITNWNNGAIFTDLGDANEETDGAIFQMYANGVIDGYTDNTFKPDRYITRAEACKIIIKSLFSVDDVDTILANVYNENYTEINLGEKESGKLDSSGLERYYLRVKWDGIYSITLNGQAEYTVSDVDNNPITPQADSYEFESGDAIIVTVKGSANNEFDLTIDDAKTVYITLYDSNGGSDNNEYDTGKARYYDENGNRFTYDEEFFVNYMKLIKDVNANFVITVRDLDFGAQYSDGNSQAYAEYMLEENITYLKERAVCYIKGIIKNIVDAYNDCDSNSKPAFFPRITIGAPHLTCDDAASLSDAEREEIVSKYREIVDYVYSEIYNYVNEEDTIPNSALWGIYYAKEDPFEIGDTGGLWYNNMKSISNYIHQEGKRMLWAPYTVCDEENLRKIGNIANCSKDDNGNDMCDIVEIQPGYYYYEVSTKSEEEIIKFIEGDLKKSYTDNVVYRNDSIVGGQKTTDTKIILEVEYDASIFTGRENNGNVGDIKGKVNRFLKTFDTYKDIIYDDVHSYGIYAGGPSEQDYKHIYSSDTNNNKHSNRNHTTLLCDLGEVLYYEFYDYLVSKGYSYYDKYNVKIISDITNGVFYNEWSDEIQSYLNNGEYSCSDENGKYLCSGTVDLGDSNY